MYKLREDIQTKIKDNKVELKGFINGEMKNLTLKQIKLFNKLNSGVESNLLKEYTDEEKVILNALIKQKALISYSNNENRNEIWLSHFSSDSNLKLSALENKTVLIIGVGGTGAIIADHLARVGIKKFIIIDGAKFDAPDLNRQLPYTKDDIGKFKVDLLEKYLNDNFHSEVISINKYIECEKDIEDLLDCHIDLIINCADKPRNTIHKLTTTIAIKSNTPILYGAVGIEDYTVGPLLTNKKAKTSFLEMLSNESNEGQVVKGSICFTNTMASADIAKSAFSFLCDLMPTEDLNKCFLINPFKFTRKTILSF